MSNSVHDKLEAFLTWYNDLYGSEWFVENESELVALLSGGPAKKLPQASGGASTLAKYRKEIENCQKCSLLSLIHI